jgi:pimeloyl-ACP methyl ester carboxylesterase
MAISGGGPYAAHVMAKRPDSIRSAHIACAFSEALPGHTPAFDLDTVAENPVSWWAYPPHSAVAQIPGFVDSTVDEATRAMFAHGRHQEPDGLRHAFTLYTTAALPALDAVTAPTFLYWGSDDRLVTTAHLERWAAALPHAVAREYPGEGHDVQYRHWDQVLCDVAYLGQRIVVSSDQQTMLAPADRAKDLLDDGWTLGLRAWRR